MAAVPRTFVGFGFGAIQAGLFAYEAGRSGNFERLVLAEVVPEIVQALRRARGRYRINVATRTGIEVREVSGVELLNPAVPDEALELVAALAEASEVATALPSVDFYQRGEPTVAKLIAEGLRRKLTEDRLPCCVVYTAENHNHAAEILQRRCEVELEGAARAGTGRVCQFLNTVIGKMSGVVAEPEPIAAEGLAATAEGLPRAFLVEEFNRILITRIELAEFQRGIEVFIEKPDLLPFEEAKLYGHNAVHALMGYLANRKGYRFISEAAADNALMSLAREAFLEESGTGLIERHRGVDPLFTCTGFETYADDLLERMTNPFLKDRTERVIRDTPRKLGWEDRLIGTMRLALDAGVKPWRFALGAAAALELLAASSAENGLSDGRSETALLEGLWPDSDKTPGRKAELIGLVREAQEKLTAWENSGE